MGSEPPPIFENLRWLWTDSTNFLFRYNVSGTVNSCMIVNLKSCCRSLSYITTNSSKVSHTKVNIKLRRICYWTCDLLYLDLCCLWIVYSWCCLCTYNGWWGCHCRQNWHNISWWSSISKGTTVCTVLYWSRYLLFWSTKIGINKIIFC